MFFIVRLAHQLSTPNVVDGRWVSASEVEVSDTEDFICLNPTTYPEAFRKAGDQEESLNGWVPQLIEGFENAPRFSWDAANRKLLPFDFESDARIWSYRRREFGIQTEVSYMVRPGTEFKKLRGAIEALIEHVPALKSDPRVQEFLEYSQHIKKCVSKFPKDQLHLFKKQSS